MAEEQEQKTLDLYPLSKGKRVLLYLADLFICGILALILFHLAVYPASSAIYGYQDKLTSLRQSQKDRDHVLYGNQILFYDAATSGEDVSSFSVNLGYTCKQYVGYWTVGLEEKYDIFATYAISIRADQGQYEKFFSVNDKAGKWFEAVEGERKLKSIYAEEWKPLFNEHDTISAKGQADYEDFQNHFFLACYNDVINDIMQKDLLFEGISYKTNQENVTRIWKEMELLTVLCVYGAYVISWLLCFLLVPFVNRNHKTLGMLILRRERVDSWTLSVLKKRRVALWLPYQFALNAIPLIFLPLPAVSFNELFSLPTLLPVSLISLALVLGSLVFMLINDYNRTLGDFLTGSTTLDEASLEEIYRSKGYKI